MPSKLKLRICAIKDVIEGNYDYRWELLDAKGLLLATSRPFEKEGFCRMSAHSVYSRAKSAFQVYRGPECIPLKRKKRSIV